MGEVVGVARELLEGDGNRKRDVNGNGNAEVEGHLKDKAKSASSRCESIESSGVDAEMGVGADVAAVSEGMTV